jgi:hypothetical protein
LVHAISEAEVSTGVAVDVEVFGSVREVGIPVPGGQVDELALRSVRDRRRCVGDCGQAESGTDDAGRSDWGPLRTG